MSKKVSITLSVELDEKNVPKKIEWKSDDPPSNGEWAESKAFLLSLFDKESLETLRIDLWSSKLEVGEMNRLCYYTFKGLADTYHNATKNQQLARDVARFAQYFGEESGVLKRSIESDPNTD